MTAAEAAASISVVVDDRASMDRNLDAAVERMVEVALRQRTHGILVTRHHDRHFTVGLSGTVPFGYTEERDRRA